MDKDIEMMIKQLTEADLDAYREIIEYCESRQTGLEGIPAIVGLDDLTDPDRPIYKGAKMDEAMNKQMAVDALIFTWLYDQVEERDPHYPAIAPAMSALAEKAFVIYEGDEKPSQYRTIWQKKEEE